jgi:hypothetical protein
MTRIRELAEKIYSWAQDYKNTLDIPDQKTIDGMTIDIIETELLKCLDETPYCTRNLSIVHIFNLCFTDMISKGKIFNTETEKLLTLEEYHRRE